MTTSKTREPMTFQTLDGGLSGFSDHAIKFHQLLYRREIDDLGALETILQHDAPSITATTRRIRTLRNAVLLHEAYFGALIRGGRDPSDAFELRIADRFGSLVTLLQTLALAASNATSCWGVLVEATDTPVGEVPKLEVISIEGHDQGSPFGYRILLAIDGWEHAYWTDFGPARNAYLHTVLGQIDWFEVEKRAETPAVITVAGSR